MLTATAFVDIQSGVVVLSAAMQGIGHKADAEDPVDAPSMVASNNRRRFHRRKDDGVDSSNVELLDPAHRQSLGGIRPFRMVEGETRSPVGCRRKRRTPKSAHDA